MPTNLPVSRETLQVYADLLLTWNKRINLIGPSSESTLWDRHIADSLAICPHIPPGVETAVDLGSGAGLPGLVLAIATGLQVHLIEADARKCAFLQEAQRLTGACAIVHAARIDAVMLPPQDLVIARALTRLNALVAHAHRFLKPGGLAIFHKGRDVETEVDEARAHWSFDAAIVPYVADPPRSFAILRNIQPVSATDHRDCKPEGRRW